MNNHKKSSIIFILILIHLIFFSDLIIFGIINLFPKLANNENILFFQIIGSCIFFIIPFIIYKYFKRIPLNQILLLKPLSLKNIFVIIFLSIFMQPFLQLINVFTMLFAKNEIATTILSFLDAPYWQLLLAVAIFPAILEELIFRGLFIKEYENCSFWYSILFSGLFFGMMHLTLTQLFYATVAGVIMAYFVKITGSIWAGILSHFILNGNQITLAYISNKILKNINPISFKEEILNISASLESITLIEKALSILYSGIYFAISIPFLACGIYFFKKINKENIEKIKLEEPLKKQNNPKIFNIPFIIAIVIYILFIILKTYLANKV